jgi:hypothetical protein
MAADMTPATTTLTDTSSAPLQLLQPAADTNHTGDNSATSFVLDSLPDTAARFLGQVLGIALRSRVIGQWRFHQSVWDTLVGSDLVTTEALAVHKVLQLFFTIYTHNSYCSCNAADLVYAPYVQRVLH